MKWGFGAILALGLIYPERGETCSAPACRQSDFLGAGQQIPANAPALAWRPEAAWGGLPEQPPPFQLLAGTTTVSARGVLEPNSGFYELVLGQTLPERPLQFSGETACSMGSPAQSEQLSVGPAALLPSRLGTLEAIFLGIGSVSVATPNSGAMCGEAVRGPRIALQVRLAPEAEPWANLLLYSTYVDGARWSPAHLTTQLLDIGSSWEGHGRDLLLADCEATPPRSPLLAPGPHTVQMRARVPGTNLWLETAPLDVELNCFGSDNDAAVPDVYIDDSGPDNPRADAGAGAIVLEEEGGCACNHSGAGQVGWAILLGLIFGLGRRGRPGAKPRG